MMEHDRDMWVARLVLDQVIACVEKHPKMNLVISELRYIDLAAVLAACEEVER